MKRFFVVCAIAIGLSGTAACPSGPNPIPTIADSIIDCTIQNRSLIGSLIEEFKVLIYGKSPEWSIVYQRAKNAGKAIGGCALAEVVNDYLGTTPEEAAHEAAHQTPLPVSKPLYKKWQFWLALGTGLAIAGTGTALYFRRR